MTIVTRRAPLSAAAGFMIVPAAASRGAVGVHTRPVDRRWRHGVSLFGQLKYPAQFAHFDYVNPRAPKLGTARQGAFGTFDNFNTVVGGWKGNLAAGIDLTYESLLTPSLDEISAEYGLIAEAVSHPSDFSSATFRLRPQARWHDGRAITPEDVIFPSAPSRPIARSLRRITGRCERRKRPASVR